MGKTRKNRTVLVAVLTAALLCLSVLTAVSGHLKAAVGDVWSVPDANGWNRQVQRGGNPILSSEKDILNEGTPEYAQGYSKFLLDSADTRNYCVPLDLRYPIRFELEPNFTYGGNEVFSWGLAKRYSDCFWTDRRTVGTTVNLNQTTVRANQTNLVLQAGTRPQNFAFLPKGDIVGQITPLSKGFDLDTVKVTPASGREIATDGYRGWAADPRTKIGVRIYIGTTVDDDGAFDGDDSYFMFEGKNITGNFDTYKTRLTVTRDDFKVTADELGYADNVTPAENTVNDGNTAYFVMIGGDNAFTFTARLSQARPIEVVNQAGIPHTLPDYAFERDTVEFTAASDTAVKLTVGTEMSVLTPDVNGSYSFVMPRTGDVTVELIQADYVARFFDGDRLISTQFIQDGDKVVKPPDPPKDGYLFVAWHSASALDSPYDFNDEVTADVQLYAEWDEAWAADFVDGEDPATVYWSQNVSKAGGKATRPALNPEKDGKVFYDWYADDRYAEAFDFDAALTADTTVYARWGYAATFTIRGFNVTSSPASVTAAILPNTPFTPPAFNQLYTERDCDTIALKWYTDDTYQTEFDFEQGITCATTVYGKISDKPGAKNYVNADINGWDMFSGIYFDDAGTVLTYPNYGATSGVQSTPDGYTTFGLDNVGGIINGYAFDVSKPIYIEYSYRLIGDFSDWMMFTVCDSLSASYLSRATSAATNDLGALLVFGHKADVTTEQTAYVWKGGTNGTVPIPDYKMTQNDQNKQYNSMVVYIGETAAESYVTINGTRVAGFNRTRADFADGKAYFTVGSFSSTVVHIKITQDFGLGVSAGANGAAGIDGGISEAKFGDAVGVTVTPDAGYMVETFSVNGTDIFEDADITDNGNGSYTFTFFMPFENTDVTVSFTELKYRVRFDLVYTTELYDYRQISPGTAVTKPDDPVRAGYVFGGWFTDKAGETAFDFTAAPTGDLRLYAKWTVRVYTLTLMSADAVYDTATVSGANKRFTEPEVEPVREGYVFGGWYTDAAGTAPYNFNTIVTDDLTLYAKWTADNASGGSEGETTPGCGSAAMGLGWPAAVLALMGLGGILFIKKRGVSCRRLKGRSEH
jgi:uncharacterized repeat protein (TIGR02543 family)